MEGIHVHGCREKLALSRVYLVHYPLPLPQILSHQSIATCCHIYRDRQWKYSVCRYRREQVLTNRPGTLLLLASP